MYPKNIDELFPEYTEEEITEVLNTLPMPPHDFARRANLYGLMFGVRSGSSRKRNEHLDPVVANSCLRQALLELLVNVTGEAEKFVGFLLKDRYVSEEVPFVHNKKMETTFKGVESFNVIRTWEAVEDLSSVVVHYKIIEDVDVEETGGKAYARVPQAMVPNPRNVYIRREADDGAFLESASEKITILDYLGEPHWRIPLDTAGVKFTTGETVYLQDRQYAYVDITPPTLDAGETLEPVYPGTNLVIPQARPMEVLSGGNHRYWFYTYTLVNPDMFYEDIIDLETAPPDFWKMLVSISFKKWYETAAPMVVTVTQGDQVDTYVFDPADPTAATIKAQLVSAENGIYHFSVDPTFTMTKHCGYTPTSITAKIFYKVSPSQMKAAYRKQISRILQAVSYRVAAEMPMVDCESQMESGFLDEQRRETGTVHRNLFTNMEKYHVGYANRVGIDAYHDIMSTMLVDRKVKPKL